VIPITLLTDFGSQDEYVGVMKGVILSANPLASIVDLTHEIPSGAVEQAGWVLSWAVQYFPQGTVHVGVVDPGVGSSRRILLVQADGQFFLAPDNGLLSLILKQAKHSKVWAVTNRKFALKPVSQTFHGRDLFAPAAAQLSLGLDPAKLGPVLKRWKQLDFPKARKRAGGKIQGEVIWVDRFGNAVTNIPERMMGGSAKRKTQFQFAIRGRLLRGMQSHYRAVAPGIALAIVGSRQLIEIAVSEGSAAQVLSLQVGDSVEMTTVAV